ncbi:MAG TPA: hypothetical protein PLL30_17560 [Candidatus Krumholzibacteria bacterium]|nr:hypothetical protein [Candidatus Krumholzibacteria bacterium]HPD73585.1 hypothetical protein [Candidatus Krumholzibacteria bacterium]HRY42269.1 hypothetical protein [Candidatus Krumholzibacteria bacterium]
MTAGDLHPKFFNSRSEPWTDDEFVHYRGHRLVYTASRGKVVLVHLPGGGVVEPSSLFGAIMPRVVRNPTQ